MTGGIDRSDGGFITSARASLFDPRDEACTEVAPMPSTGDLDADPALLWTSDSDTTNDDNPGSRCHAAIAVLPGGDVLVAGGQVFSPSILYGRRSVIRYDARADRWSLMPPMNMTHVLARAVVLGTGRDVFVLGGHASSPTMVSDRAFLFEPAVPTRTR